jgi:hypothetical protein
MAGLGHAACGTAPYGLGTPATSSTNGGALLPNERGETQGSRYINPRTRRYEYDEHGRAKGMPNVQQLVLMAFMTIRGSSAMPDLGDEAPSGVIGANFVARRKEAVTRAAAHLVDGNLIEIISIDVDPKARPIFTIVRWRDLTTRIERETKV